MTAQVPDKLINEYPGLDLGELELHAVIYDINDGHGWGDGYLFSAKPRNTRPLTTACYRGFVATFRLTVDGELELVKFEYGYPGYKAQYEPTEVHEMVTGDFLLVMKEHFYARRTYIPFRDGRIVDNRSQWIYEVPSDALNNKHPELDLGGLQLYGVIRGDISANDGWGIPYKFVHKPTPMYRGKRLDEWSKPTFHVKDDGEVTLVINHNERPDEWFTPVYCVTADGEFELVEYNHHGRTDLTDEVHETATGDFWLVMREHFSRPRIYIPFRDGQVVTDQLEWRYEREHAILINEYPDLELGGLRLAAVSAGAYPGTREWDAPYQFSARPKEVQTNLVGRSYVVTLRLTPDGGLELVDYRYPALSEDQRDAVHEMAEGDFWLVMRKHFPQPRIYIPFRNGRVIRDRSEWHYERKPDWLLSEHPRLKFDELVLVAVIADDTPGTRGWGAPYRFLARPKEVQTDLAVRPYEATFRLTPFGALELVRYRYPTLSEDQRDEVHELAEGDFWLVMKRPWIGPQTYIPFHRGRIVSNQSRWTYDQEPDRIISERPDFTLATYSGFMWAVTHGDIAGNRGWGKPYQFRKRPWPAEGSDLTVLNRGYTATFRLTEDGQLELVEYRYPASSHHQADKVQELVKGNFWLVRKPISSGPRFYIPFYNSHIADRSEWFWEQDPAE